MNTNNTEINNMNTENNNNNIDKVVDRIIENTTITNTGANTAPRPNTQARPHGQNPRGHQRENRRPGGRSHGMMRPSRPPEATQVHKKVEDTVPPLAPDSIRIIPLGGGEESGKNMTKVEYGNDT